VIVRLRIGQKLTLALAALLLLTMAVAWVGIASLANLNARTRALYRDNLVTTEATTSLGASLDDAKAAALQLLLTSDAAGRSQLHERLQGTIVPAVEGGIATLRQLHATGPVVERDRVEQIAAGWADFRYLLDSGPLTPHDPAELQGAARRVAAILEPITTLAVKLAAIETQQGREAAERAAATYHTARSHILALTVGAALGWLVIAVTLVRNIVPRVQSYSRFAARVANGDLDERLAAGGGDEVAELGRTLNEMVGRREQQRAYQETQAEFVDMLQLSEAEAEAHDLLKRHLERSIANSRVTVLNRNNSADRLEAVTTVSAHDPLAASLQGAKPRSCLAVRFGRLHRGGDSDRAPLLGCEVCGTLPDAVTCQPLLVSGEVIGSVLVNHPKPPPEDVWQRIRESVTQAAPVLANLRNLAIAEIRAATDALTGLPNNRAVRDTIKRMVAQASRTVSPLSAALLDLDHFKRINDTYGHGRGDEVLAEVAAVLGSSVRESDFVGRYGGEEFLILLPDTDKQQTQVVAEKVRAAVAAIAPSTIDWPVTASLGVATLPHDAGDADTLIRAADRALYVAKGNGRNRVELFVSPDKPASQRTEAERGADEQAKISSS
jgi:diguanylate cyclase (GGDEF)-like protein